jgi:hypothetical protein
MGIRPTVETFKLTVSTRRGTRKPMTASELIALGRQIEALERPKALERMAETGRTGVATRPNVSVPDQTGDAMA